MTTFRALPTYTQPLTTGQNLAQSWYRWMHDTDAGTPPSNEAVVTVTASPFVYQAPKRGFVIIAGGAVSNVQFTRSATYSTGMVSGMFPVSLGDQLTITYSAAPEVVFVPT
jgi:hypothetical protein